MNDCQFGNMNEPSTQAFTWTHLIH